jgi:hypothetical protein
MLHLPLHSLAVSFHFDDALLVIAAWRYLWSEDFISTQQVDVKCA